MPQFFISSEKYIKRLSAFLLFVFNTCSANRAHRPLDNVHDQHLTSSCLVFDSYVSSRWEKQWAAEANERQHNICGILKHEAELSRTWVEGVEAAKHQGFIGKDDEVWSHFQFRNTCSPDHEVLKFPIEPTVGLLRNPFAAPCSLAASPRDVEDRDHMLVAPAAFTMSFPGKKLLFDLGSGKSYDSSLRWFVESYQQRGITFDELYAWEVQEVGPHDYWRTVPDDILGKLHFYNTYASDSAGVPSPLGILKSKYAEGDFVVIKLDIDNQELEANIMQQVSEMTDMIGEMYFERHFDAPEMRYYFGAGLSTNLQDTLDLFQTFRAAGLRLHYWP